jgi:hypothetical protein
MMKFLGVVVLLAATAAIVAALLRPVCVPLSPKESSHNPVAFDEREDRDLFVVKIYQRHGNQRFECKTWLTREVLE